MNIIENKSFEGERPLYAISNVKLKNIKFHPGESALKECSNIQAINCEFMGKYPFWHNAHSYIEDSLFIEGGRAAIWYCEDIHMINTLVNAPKMFREIDGLYLKKVKLTDAAECIWYCRNIEIDDVEIINGDYIFKNSENIKINNLDLHGNYGFQYNKNVEIRNSHIRSKDAFWNTENVTVFDSVIEGEYLGWHSKNLRLINCVISGTQPLCYADNLVMENCKMKEDADLAFEYSTLNVEINSFICSIKNPKGGEIYAKKIGNIIIDENCKNLGGCKIEVETEVNV